MRNDNLLNRSDFKLKVFNRDSFKCALCGDMAVDAHHIIDRSLWDDGGYYMDNGASVCSPCHMKCETTEISVECLREKCGITNIILPVDFDISIKYDKWGNEVLPNGTRMKGVMFFNDGVQKVLRRANMLEIFTDLVKYPRTPHLPMSEGISSDDRVLASMDIFHNKEIVVTEKMDGENTTLYSHYVHARSLDSKNHPSRNLLKSYHAGICHDIPDGMRICGENMFAKHSIHYDGLPHHFLGFSMWDDKNRCLPWNDTMEWFELIGIEPVREIWRGVFSEDKLFSIIKDLKKNKEEGFVIRLDDGFHHSVFNKSVAKFVRKGHVNTDKHWMSQDVIKNGFSV